MYRIFSPGQPIFVTGIYLIYYFILKYILYINKYTF